MPIIYPVAGGKGGIGKSFITANIGWLLAKEGKKVLLADLDLGSANLHTILGISDPPKGLNDFLNKSSPALMETIIPCQIPGLFLLSARDCPMEAANLPAAQKQKIITALTKLPFDFILLDLGAGTNFNALDFSLASNDVILIFTQEPTSIESGVRFIQTVYYRKLKQLFTQHRINAIITNANGPSTPSLQDLLCLLRNNTDNNRDPLKCLEKISFKIIINQVKNQNSQTTGEALLKLCQRHFYSRFELIGAIDQDEKIKDAIYSKQLFVRKFPFSKTTYNLMRTTRNLLPAKNSFKASPVKPFFDRDFYEVLEIHPHASASKVYKAYQDTISLYRENPMIANSFFSTEECNRVMGKIDTAGRILGDPVKRNEYDRLLESGKNAINDNNKQKKSGESKTTADKTSAGTWNARLPRPGRQNLNNKPEAMELFKKITGQHVISGLDLKAFRKASGINIETLFQKTRVGMTTLKTIEEDRFEALPPLIYLKGFLKAYAQALRLPAGAVVEGYLRNIEKKKRYRPAGHDSAIT